MMSSTRLCLSIPAALIALAAACTADVGEEEAITKEEARAQMGKSDIGADLCELYGWYGDGVCDEFCIEPDPDCGECAAVPTCGAGEVEHARWEDCPADASCREVTECGATIWCSDTATCAAVPTCDPGETEHARWEDCPADASCREVTECGATIWCSSSEAPECAGDNPQGCVSTGCPDGYHCDTSMGTAPSACDCDPEHGSWICTADVSGGICVAD